MKYTILFLMFSTCALAQCAITTVALPRGKVGAAYFTAITTRGCGTGLSFSTPGGALPSGLLMDNTGKISGTPTQNGWFWTKVAAKGSGSAATIVYWTEIAPGTPPAATPRAPASASGVKHEIKLTWDASVPAPSSYSAYRAISPGGPYERVASGIPAPAWTDSVTGGTTYYYVVTAVKDGVESICSNEVKAVAP
jgi:hypothetical protein